MKNHLPPLPLNIELLKKYNFFELYLPDGGGSFILRELFGSLDDRRIVDALLNTPVMDEFGSLDDLDFGRFEKWRTIEKSCWLNRCYFIVPLAKYAYLKSDKVLMQKVLDIMLNFGRRNPAPDDLQAHWQRVTRRMTEDYNSKTPEEIAVDETNVEYIWYDMQAAQRLISFLYAAHFIKELLADLPAMADELTALLKKHVRVIADQEAFQKPYCDNHQSLRAIALYWGLPLLQNDADYPAVHKRAVELCSWHIINEFMPGSGALFENSPSYHAFVLWHARDFIRLAAMRGDAVAPEVPERFEAAKRALFAYRRPDGLALTINDSYQYDATPLADSLGGVDSVDMLTVLKPGGLATGQLGDCYAAMDVSNFIGEFSHYHGGKNSVVLMWKKEAFLEDCGCPSYDAEEFTACRRSDWHTALLVNHTGDTHAYSMYGFDRWAELEYADSWQEKAPGEWSFDSTLTSNEPVWQNIKWQRSIALKKDGIRLSDTVKNSAGNDRTYTLLFNMAPGVEIENVAPEQWLLKKSGLTCRMSLQSTASPARVSIRELKNCQQRIPRTTLQLQIEFELIPELESVADFRFDQ